MENVRVAGQAQRATLAELTALSSVVALATVAGLALVTVIGYKLSAFVAFQQQ